MDPEAQLSAPQYCAWSTTPIQTPILTVLTVNPGTGQDDVSPDDAPPAYTSYPPPPLVPSGSDPSEPAANRMVGGLRLYGTVIGVILTVAFLVTATFFTFFNRSKV
jgi:hypothetical protein